MQALTQNEMKEWLTGHLGPRRSGTRKKLAAFLGVSQDKVTRWANTEPDKESNVIPADIFMRMQIFFNDFVAAPESNGMTIPIVGYLGAGAVVEPDFEQIPPEGLNTIEFPFAITDDLIAFEVKDVSMIPVYHPGAIIVVYRDQRKPIESFYGRAAAVRTADGRRYIKTIHRGSTPSTVNLSSFNDPDLISDVHPVWIGEIFAIFPPPFRSLQRR